MIISEKDGENVSYIATAIRFHFLNILRKINRVHDKEKCNLNNITHDTSIDTTDIIFEDMISTLDSQKQYILRLKFKEMLTDIEISNKIGKSRQTVHKQLKKAYTEILKSEVHYELRNNN